jgi:hypothetical protein
MEADQLEALELSTHGSTSSNPPTTLFYWTPLEVTVGRQQQQQQEVIDSAPDTVKPKTENSYVFYQVFAFTVTVLCNFVFGTIAWILARELFRHIFLIQVLESSLERF